MLSSILSTFANCFKVPELKSRIRFTVFVLMICRLVALVPIPGLDGGALSEFFRENAKSTGSVMGLFNMFTGGAFSKCSIGALGIMPYISATIIIQLMSAVLPGLSKLAREEGGRTKIVQYGRYLTVILCIGQGFVMTLGWEHPERVFGPGISNIVMTENVLWYRLQTVVILTTGTLLLMWLGEQITDRGIGNGISLVITVGILSGLPFALSRLYTQVFPPSEAVEAALSPPVLFVLIALLIFVVGGVIAVTQAQRKVPVQHAQRAVGRKIYSGGSSFMPLRVNYAGVMPIIFAQAILMFPEKIFMTLGSVTEVSVFTEIGRLLTPGSLLYLLTYAGMILFFSYFWVATQFNEIQIADDLKKSGGYIPGVRPGQETTKFLHRTMSRITFAGAIFLTIIAIIPDIMNRALGVDYYVGTFFGGTSILIIVGVLLDTMRQVESHLMMRHYDGFLKKGRIKGQV